MKKAFCFLLVAMLLFCTMETAISAQTENEGYNWYVRRNKEHKQPKPDGVFLQMNREGVFYVDADHGDGNREKVLYLTFDAGYENGNVEKVLKALNEENVPGAFFVLSHFVRKNPELAKKIVDNGHLLCNHSARHKDMTQMSFEEFRSELCNVEAACEEITGHALARFFRPPEGRYNQSVLNYARECGYQTVFWSFAYADWDNAKQPSKEAAMAKIMENVHNGAILLLHPTSQTNADILQEVIRALKKEGYRFASLNELCDNV